MTRFLAIIIVALLSISTLLAVGCSQEAAAPSDEPGASDQENTDDAEDTEDEGGEDEAHASINVTSPTEGQTISGTTVTVAAEAQDVELVPGGGSNDHTQGHLHITLDDGGVKMTPDADTELTDVSPGSHTLTVELVENNHQPKSPEVKKTITFTTQ